MCRPTDRLGLFVGCASLRRGPCYCEALLSEPERLSCWLRVPRAAAGRAAVDGVVAALVTLLRLGPSPLKDDLPVSPPGARRVEILVLVLEVVSLRHRVPPIQVPFPARSLGKAVVSFRQFLALSGHARA